MFPRVFGVRRIKVHDGWDHWGWRTYKTDSFEGSTAYLVAEHKQFFENREPKKTYEVVFYGKEEDDKEPSFNIMDGHCTNSIILSDIFFTLEDAEIAAETYTSYFKGHGYLSDYYDMVREQAYDK